MPAFSPIEKKTLSRMQDVENESKVVKRKIEFGTKTKKLKKFTCLY
jgi:hypothetical protein